MGMFIGHAGPGFFWLSIGLWHLFCNVRNYAKRPDSFRTRAWHPVKSSGALKYLELYLIMLFAGLEIAMELFILPHKHQPFGEHWEVPANHLRNFEHSSMSFFFFLYALVALISETTAVLPLPWGALNCLAAVAFSQEFMLFYFHSADHAGLEGQYHFLLLLAITAGATCMILEIVYPNSFNLPFVRSMSMVLQGTWFWQTAFSIFGGSHFVADGCRWSTDAGMEPGIVCDTEMQMMRGKALANLFFNWHLAGILVGSLTLFGVMMRRHQSVEYNMLLADRSIGAELCGKEEKGELKSGVVHVLDEDEEELMPLANGNGSALPKIVI